MPVLAGRSSKLKLHDSNYAIRHGAENRLTYLEERRVNTTRTEADQARIHDRRPQDRAATTPKLTVSVVVPTRDRNADLDRCLEAVDRLDPAPLEVIVVDSAPTKEDAHKVASKWGARYVLESDPGASRARNRGAREARGDIVAYTDDDAVPHPTWLSWITAEFQDAIVALVAGRVMPPDAAAERIRWYELCGFSGQSEHRILVDRNIHNWFEKITFLPFGLGANLAIRRSAFSRWHGFNERLGPGTLIPGHEEQHAFLKLIDLGFRLVYAPNAHVTHPLNAQSIDELRSRSLRRLQASSAYFTLLIAEEPRHWFEVVRYVTQKLGSSMKSRISVRDQQLPLLRGLLARLQGPSLYMRSRWVSRA